MNLRGVFHAVGLLLFFVGVSMLAPLAVSLLFGGEDAWAIFASMGITLGAGVVVVLVTRGHSDLGTRDGFGVVTFGWLAIAFFGTLPFLLSGAISDPTDAMFETMSGFTTTGASILTDIEALPRGVLFWRCFMQWIGGMGIIVLSLAILPMLGVGGMQLYRAEAPGPTPDKLTPRIRQTAVLLWGVYLVLSVAQAIALQLAGMDWYDAVCHTFTTMATGGFSTKNASIAAYENPAVHWIIILFMVLAGTNFALHYRVRGNPLRYAGDAEFRWYFWILLVATAGVTVALWFGEHQTWEPALRHAAFQVVSIVTTTGYTTDDWDLWHAGPQWVIVVLMFFGGCGGSTAGSMKIIRIVILGKAAMRELARTANPRVVLAISLGRGRKLQPGIARNVLAFFVLFMGIVGLGSLSIALLGIDIDTALSASVSCLSNVGPGLGHIGPTENYGWMPPAAKWILVLLMLTGRLELYTVLALLLPQTWKR
jgi:trk system potassium uptake protein TrkH